MYIDIDNIVFLISSNINYYKYTKDKIITSLLNSNIKKQNIHFVVGGCNLNYINKGYYYTNINSFDFTSLIYFVYNNLIDTNKVYFLLHDTTIIHTEEFKINIQKILDFDNAIKLCSVVSMNIGLYKGSFILDKKEDILKYFNISSDPIILNSLKGVLVQHEDVIFKDCNYLNIWDDKNERCDVNGNSNVNGNYNLRYFKFPGITKIQRNFQGLQDNYIINY